MLAMMMGSRSSFDPILRRQLGRIVDVDHRSVGEQHLVDDGRRAGDQIQAVLALQSLLHDIHVQQSQESAAKTKPQRGRHFRLEMQRRIVELELLQRVAELFVVVGTDRKQAGENPRLHLLEAGERLFRGIVFQRDGVAHRARRRSP